MARLCVLAFCVTAASAAAQCDLTAINPAAPQLPNAIVGQFYAVTFSASGASDSCPVSWFSSPNCFSGSGLTFQDNFDNTATIFGTPTTPGSYSCTVRVSLADPFNLNMTYTLLVFKEVPPCKPPQITSGDPPAVSAGVPYLFTVTATGTPPLSFAATGLPTGLTINSATGVIAGTTNAAGNYAISISVSGCGPSADAQQYTMLVVTSPPPPPLSAVTLSLLNQPNPALFGQTIAVLAHASDGTVVPTGSVLLCVVAPGQYCAPPVGAPPPGTDPSLITPLLSAPLDGNGNASFALTGLLIQNYVLQAYYGGDIEHLPASAGPVDQFVIKGVLVGPPASPRTSKEDPPPPAQIPTLSWTAWALLALAIAGLAAAHLRRRTRGG